jgi:5-formyltetrahydrofolate cyclo-ligase
LWSIGTARRRIRSTTGEHPWVTVTVTKQQWRARLLAARRARPEPERAAARQRVTDHLLAALAGSVSLTRPDRSLTVCAFHPLPSEPVAADLPERLAAEGIRVLVPVVRPAGPLDWCELGGATRPGALGIVEPTGPRLGPAAIRQADVVLVPALAVDGDGVRLGRGGGHYDRSLALLAAPPAVGPAPRLIALVYDDEVVDALPRDAHDVTVTEVLTPTGGLRHVARGAHRGASSD